MERNMAEWRSMFVPEVVIKALDELKFDMPTQIQKLSIPYAIRDHRDIIGAAETGSGKTLAFGIPLITRILSLKEHQENSKEKPLYSLILTPTRELANQITKHLKDVSKHTDIKISTIIGGMSLEKQRRLLKKCPEIVVATPGGLWELIEEEEEHLKKISSIKQLVIDEADRMMEKGHFAELTHILNLINRQSLKRQIFVYSATLTFEHETPRRLMLKKNIQKINKNMKLDSFIKCLGMRNPKVIDITRRNPLVQSLSESQVLCNFDEKDVYLYYFLSVYREKTIVFCNSIGCVKRLRTILDLLNFKTLPLHAQMHQKQRLKNFDKFTSSKVAVLIATDVAGRGLDVKDIKNVVHYQVPQTAEAYIHRSGRTARAKRAGFSLMLVEPQEGVFYKRLCKTLNKGKPLPNFDVNQDIFKKLKERVITAREIDKYEHILKKQTAEKQWFLNAAKAADIEIDEEMYLSKGMEKVKSGINIKNINQLKKKLKKLLQQSIPITH